MTLADRHALLTGASYGLGAYVARALAAAGARVSLVARSEAKLDAVRAELAASGAVAVAIPADITEPDDRARLLGAAEAAHGPVDVLVNNAGLPHGGRITHTSPAAIDRVLATNLVAPIQLSRLVLPGMIERRRGHLVQMSSLAGKLAAPYSTIYSATKHGLVGFTHSLQAELAGTGVSASVVVPGFVSREGMWARLERPVHAAFGISTPERVAQAVVRTIERGKIETVVNPLPVRPAIALWALAPGLGALMFRALGVDEFMRATGVQVEQESELSLRS